tara:strand:- start:8594 stop:9853 length:1260 start_codon:yes stop_codon:yes gene_type:complete
MLTISQLMHQIKNGLAHQFPKQLLLIGEIDNWKYSRGNAYFALKDKNGCTMPAVMWQEALQDLNMYSPKNGDQIKALAQITVWEKAGKMQLIISTLSKATAEKGEKQKLLDKWKSECEKQGYFCASKKQKVPNNCTKISLVTSNTGAALHDCLSVIQRRCPGAYVRIHDAIVQGADCPKSVVAGIQAAEKTDSEVIIVTRGGGSKDDLFFWNDPRICQAVFAASKPIVSGVGHDIDTNLVDFAADLSCPTPSVAAEKTTLDRSRANKNKINALEQCHPKKRIAKTLRRLETIKHRLLLANQNKLNALAQCHPKKRIIKIHHRLEAIKRRLLLIHEKRHSHLDRIIRQNTSITEARIKGIEARLKAMDPHKSLVRGFSIVRTSRGTVCKSAKQVTKLKQFIVELAEGAVIVDVKSTKIKN